MAIINPDRHAYDRTGREKRATVEFCNINFTKRPSVLGDFNVCLLQLFTFAYRCRDMGEVENACRHSLVACIHVFILIQYR